MTGYIHELKTDHEPFAAILSGEKTHEIRYDDRGFKVGDTLVLRETRYSRGEMFAEGRPLEYTGRTAERVVTHIQSGYGLPRSMVVMSLAVPSASIADTAGAKPVAWRYDTRQGFSYHSQQLDHFYTGWDGEYVKGEPLYAAPRPAAQDDAVKSAATTVPEGWMLVPKHRGTAQLKDIIIAASLACIENRLMDADDRHELAHYADQLQHASAAPPAPSVADAAEASDKPLTDAQIEAGWRQTFSTDNPYCPCNLKSFTKAVRWAERAKEQK